MKKSISVSKNHSQCLVQKYLTNFDAEPKHVEYKGDSVWEFQHCFSSYSTHNFINFIEESFFDLN